MLFRYGELGETFYVILRGLVSVWIPCDLATVENAFNRITQLINSASDQISLRYYNQFDELMTI